MIIFPIIVRTGAEAGAVLVTAASKYSSIGLTPLPSHTKLFFFPV